MNTKYNQRYNQRYLLSAPDVFEKFSKHHKLIQL